MKTARLLGAVLASIGVAAPALAQMSVTTLGATDAAACYQNANNGFESDTGPCDSALDDRGTTRSDKMKTHVNRGIIHNRNGDLQAALDDFNDALDINSGLAEAYLNRGNTYFLAGDNDAALADYEQSLELGISKPWAAWYNIGLAYDAKKDPVRAQEAYAKALEINPNFTQAQNKLKP